MSLAAKLVSKETINGTTKYCVRFAVPVHWRWGLFRSHCYTETNYKYMSVNRDGFAQCLLETPFWTADLALAEKLLAASKDFPQQPEVRRISPWLGRA